MAPIKQFSIVPDSGKTIYHPGDEVKGRVFVHLKGEASIRSVTLSLRGEANVRYNEGKTHYELTQPYFSFASYLYGAADQREKSVKFSPGEYWFPFSFTLPPVSLPSSYQDKTAFVRYLLKAVLEKPTMKAKVAIIVMEPVNVHIPYLQLCQTEQDIEDICCCGDRGGKVNVSGKINKSGFLPGEVIQAKFYVENHSIRHVTSTDMYLVQKVEKRYDKHIYNVDTKKEFLSAAQSGGVPSRTEADIEGMSLTIPDSIPPSTTSEDSIVRVCYTVRLTAHVKGRCNNACTVVFPITIGYMPDGFDWSIIQPEVDSETHFPLTVGNFVEETVM